MGQHAVDSCLAVNGPGPEARCKLSIPGGYGVWKAKGSSVGITNHHGMLSGIPQCRSRRSERIKRAANATSLRYLPQHSSSELGRYLSRALQMLLSDWQRSGPSYPLHARAVHLLRIACSCLNRPRGYGGFRNTQAVEGC